MELVAVMAKKQPPKKRGPGRPKKPPGAEKLVRVTFHIPESLQADWAAYAEYLAKQAGRNPNASEAFREMFLEAMARDKEFRKSR